MGCNAAGLLMHYKLEGMQPLGFTFGLLAVLFEPRMPLKSAIT